MNDSINEESTVTSASTDLDMDQVRARRKEIRESLEKLQELSERSQQLNKELSDATAPLMEALKVLDRQLEPVREAQKRLVRNLGFDDQFGDLDDTPQGADGLLKVEYEEEDNDEEKKPQVSE